MLTLNLISQDLKKEIKLKRIYGFVKKTYYLLAILIITTTITLLIAKIVLQNEFNKIVEQTTLVTKNSQSYNVKVREINSKIDNAGIIQDNYMTWSYLFEEITKLTPEDVTISFIKTDKTKQNIKIRGIADSRDGLLLFKNELEDSLIFTDIQFPIQNILKKNNINFEIDAKIIIEKI